MGMFSGVSMAKNSAKDKSAPVAESKTKGRQKEKRQRPKKGMRNGDVILRDLIKDSNRTAAELCRVLGWKEARISRYLSGERAVTVEDIVAVAGAVEKDGGDKAFKTVSLAFMRCLRELFPNEEYQELKEHFDSLADELEASESG